MLDDELRDVVLTSGLTDSQRAELLAVSEELYFAPGDVLFVEAAPATCLWILLEGSVELSRQTATERTVIGTMSTAGQWAGGFLAWEDDPDNAGSRATGTAVDDVRCLCVPSDELGRLADRWFPFGKHMIVGIYRTVRQIEAAARQRESLVALGTLAAGLAHEINNPAAASLRAVESLRTACDAMLSSFTQLAEAAVSPDQLIALDTVRVEAAASEPEGGLLAAADLEEAIGQWLEDRGVDDGWSLASVLAAGGIDIDRCTRLEQQMGADALGPALHWTASTLAVNALLDEMHGTTTRITQLVESVKSYSQMDRSPLQRVDVHEGIESTLVMLAPKLACIEIERAFAPDIPEFEAHGGELNQVWTNLFDNAADAMDGDGVLRITTGVEGRYVIVAISDTGHGMPAGVEARAFEPFFTTKDVGRGTGLGLDVVRRIIDKHGGTITFDSSPTGTIAHVRIPMSRDDPDGDGSETTQTDN